MRSMRSATAMALLAAAFLVAQSPSSHAARGPVADCQNDSPRSRAWWAEDTFVAPGHRLKPWWGPRSRPAGAPRFVVGDVVRFYAWGTTQIGTFGANKHPTGDPDDIAPSGEGWPLPGAPKYALLVRVARGSARIQDGADAGRLLDGWVSMGAKSPCIRIESRTRSRLRPVEFQFMINDPKRDDNNDGPTVYTRQWRLCAPPHLRDPNCGSR
ncbi:hypothetical protein GCM10017673_18250 [Streptosporangium violaceochromogenes]|nr:hypothetical protein GCM10017673_18250 [Streptosporangium violaceochromogenes]